ncbi:MAG TPA: aldehyde reductase [Trebonia sp.]|nr:aldehyde reductase [Trebonia sp.]
MTTDATVLVTGGTGFLAGYCIAQLLRAGYRVRATVRTAAKTGQVERAARAAGAVPDGAVPDGALSDGVLSFTVADLTSDADWAEAVRGCDYVLHVASPLPRDVPRDASELIDPAREGTLRVLRAARDAGVRRTVLTSSFAAIGYGHPPTARPFTEDDWTNVDAPEVNPYLKSKTLAERAAWDFAARDGGGMELAVVNPVGIFGPVLGPDFASSIGVVKAMLAGELPRTPRLWTAVVDVRDAADLHLRAMTSPRAAGERFIAAAGDAVSYHHIAQTLRDRLGPDARHVPARDIPSWFVHAGAPFVPAFRQFTVNLDKVRHVDNAKARTVLDWRPRSAEDAVTATAESLLALGLVSR